MHCAHRSFPLEATGYESVDRVCSVFAVCAVEMSREQQEQPDIVDPSPAPSEEEDVISKVTEHFGDAIAQRFKDEGITCPEAIVDLLSKDADAPIYSKVGLTYGKALKFKRIFEESFQLPKKSSSALPKCKPTMAELSTYDPEIQRLYLSKRKKIGALAMEKWGGQLPKFNTPMMRTQLEKFAKEIEDQCSVPEINFTVDGIMQHTKDFFSEQRRERKRTSPPDSWSPRTPSSSRAGSSDEEFSLQCSQAKLPKMPSMGSQDDEEPDDEGSDNDGSDDDGSDDDKKSTDTLPETEPTVINNLHSKAVKVIIKAVCGSIPKDREVIVDALKNTFFQ
ncbi:uncharacterized protein LOC125567953 [Nematostella vectensis]|uniref:uncharacterized protein LOC125567953 n=1 Tax=Nematostella vectensis TaxID=45351 RepID=UPI0020777D26|nr:uncharacterized protein LOC125567953 [Nematostella vectensis]